MKCELIQADLKAYRDNELPMLRRLAVRRHLAQCRACREEINTMEKIAQTLQSAESAEPLSSDLRSRILTDAALTPAERKGGTVVDPLVKATRRRLSPAIVGAVCAIIALAAFVTLPVFHESREKARQVSPEYSGAQDAYVMSKNEPFPARRTAGGPIITTYGQPSAASSAQWSANLPQPLKPVPVIVAGSPAPMAAPASDLPADFSLERQVHREANLTVQLKDPEAASDQVEEMTKDAGGYVAENDLTTDDSGNKSSQMTLKVPVSQFDTVLGEVEKLGNVTAKNITGQDITGKVSDAGQAESVLEDEVARSNSHLAALGRHAKWEDEEDARQLRIELAQSRARVVLLHKLAALADISVSLILNSEARPADANGILEQHARQWFSGVPIDDRDSKCRAIRTDLDSCLHPDLGTALFAVWYTRRYLRETRA